MSHRTKAALCSLGWWTRSGVLLFALGVVGLPVYQKSIGLGLLHTALTFIAVFSKAWAFSSDQTMKVVRSKYLERKVRLYGLIKELQRRSSMSPSEVRRFQRDTLCLIASYVRSHRADLSETEIYVNLLIEDGDDVLVIARDSDHRQPGARYPRRLMAAAKVFETGNHEVVANVHKEYGDVEKAYRSILLLPVRGPTSVLAVVSIDSAKAHHFDLEADELERYLAPYIALLEWSLTSWQPALRET